MNNRVALGIPVIAVLAGCGGGGASNVDMNISPGGASFSDVLQAQRDSEGVFSFFPLTPASDPISGSFTYEGLAVVEQQANRRDSDVNFIAYGLLNSEVDFTTNQMTATGSNFYQLDAAQYNSSGQERARGAIAGDISYAATLTRDRGFIEGLMGQATGTLTSLEGTPIVVDADATAVFALDGAPQMYINGPSTNSATTNLDEAFNAVRLYGIQQ
ncbi:hypothetical protein [Yoonia sp. 208BN28-4]|uniref:hypothetical protein n=1 Tax=Yoonia sp. 208BN28-4 TaxID=3126505 RepID=UPI00309ED441